MTPNFVPEPYDAPAPRIGLAAVGPAMLKVAAEESDAAKLHVFCTRQYLEHRSPISARVWPSRAASARTSRSRAPAASWSPARTTKPWRKLFDWVRYRVAFDGSTPAYWPVFEEHGLGDLGRKLNTMTKAGQWNQIAAEVSDEVVHLFAAVGRHDQIAKAIEARFGGLVDFDQRQRQFVEAVGYAARPDPGHRTDCDALSYRHS